MNRAIGILGVAFILCAAAWPAQAAPLQFGVKAGMVSSKVRYSGTVDGLGDIGANMNDLIDARTGWGAGVFATLGLGPMLSIQPELLFVRKGWKWEESFPEVDTFGQVVGLITTRQEYAVDYLQVPVVGRWTPPLAGPVRPSVYAGPALSFKIGSDGRWWINGQEVLSGNLGVDELAQRITATEVGVVLGVEVEFRRFLVDARYDVGLTDILETGAGTENVKTLSRSLILMGGYRF